MMLYEVKVDVFGDGKRLITIQTYVEAENCGEALTKARSTARKEAQQSVPMTEEQRRTLLCQVVQYRCYRRCKGFVEEGL